MTNEEVFKNYGSEKWVIEEALSYLLQEYWEEVTQKYPQIGKQIGKLCPINPVGAVKEFMKEETYCSVGYAEKSKLDTLEKNEIECEECPKEIFAEKEEREV